MNIEQNQPNGSLKISQEVIATIAKYAVEEIDGIHSLASSSSAAGTASNGSERGSLNRHHNTTKSTDVRERSIYLCFCVASHICGFCYCKMPGLAGHFLLLHAELVDAAVCVSLAWTEEG